MTQCVRLEPTELIPSHASVYDFDELPEQFQAELSTAAPDSTGGLCLGGLERGPAPDEYIRFTGYYRVARAPSSR
jgi:hypothetical protein